MASSVGQVSVSNRVLEIHGRIIWVTGGWVSKPQQPVVQSKTVSAGPVISTTPPPQAGSLHNAMAKLRQSLAKPLSVAKGALTPPDSLRQYARDSSAPQFAANVHLRMEGRRLLRTTTDVRIGAF